MRNLQPCPCNVASDFVISLSTTNPYPTGSFRPVSKRLTTTHGCDLSMEKIGRVSKAGANSRNITTTNNLIRPKMIKGRRLEAKTAWALKYRRGRATKNWSPARNPLWKAAIIKVFFTLLTYDNYKWANSARGWADRSQNCLADQEVLGSIPAGSTDCNIFVIWGSNVIG